MKREREGYSEGTDAVLSLRIGIATRSDRITLVKQQLQGGKELLKRVSSRYLISAVKFSCGFNELCRVPIYSTNFCN